MRHGWRCAMAVGVDCRLRRGAATCLLANCVALSRAAAARWWQLMNVISSGAGETGLVTGPRGV